MSTTPGQARAASAWAMMRGPWGWTGPPPPSGRAPRAARRWPSSCWGPRSSAPGSRRSGRTATRGCSFGRGRTTARSSSRPAGTPRSGGPARRCPWPWWIRPCGSKRLLRTTRRRSAASPTCGGCCRKHSTRGRRFRAPTSAGRSGRSSPRRRAPVRTRACGNASPSWSGLGIGPGLLAWRSSQWARTAYLTAGCPSTRGWREWSLNSRGLQSTSSGTAWDLATPSPISSAQ